MYGNGDELGARRGALSVHIGNALAISAPFGTACTLESLVGMVRGSSFLPEKNLPIPPNRCQGSRCGIRGVAIEHDISDKGLVPCVSNDSIAKSQAKRFSPQWPKIPAEIKATSEIIKHTSVRVGVGKLVSLHYGDCGCR